MRKFNSTRIIFLIFLFISTTISSDIEIEKIFKENVIRFPAAFGDFNSDRYADMFVLHENKKRFDILLANIEAPLFRFANLSCNFNETITSIVPGDFNGDVFMDILVTTNDEFNDSTNVYVLWGKNGTFDCPAEHKLAFNMKGQPLAIDYNNDMIIDLFGSNLDGKRMLWTYKNNKFQALEFPGWSFDLPSIRVPHSNAFLDLNYDFNPDLMVTTDTHFEIWLKENDNYQLKENISWTEGIDDSEKFDGHIGQSLFLDTERKGKMDLIVPICYDSSCNNSSIFVYNCNQSSQMSPQLSYKCHQNLNIDFFNKEDNNLWSFVPPSGENNKIYTDVITLRGGDINIDGYPDLLVTLISKNTSKIQSFLLLNEKCDNCGKFGRTFKIQWNYFNGFSKNSIMAVFYDFHHDGILDVIMIQHNNTRDEYSLVALKNNYDYDATFVQVMVISGLENDNYYPNDVLNLGKKGTNLPGPSISYTAEFLFDNKTTAIAAQLSQSAYFSLNLPYTTFGLGRAATTVEGLKIGVCIFKDLFNLKKKKNAFCLLIFLQCIIDNLNPFYSAYKLASFSSYIIIYHMFF